MKSLPTFVAACLLALLSASPAVAERRVQIGEGRLMVTGRGACGCPVHARQVCTGYDRNKRPVYTSYRQPFVCGCNKDHGYVNARRKFEERRETEYRNQQERLHKAYTDYERDLDNAFRKHQRELASHEEDRYRNPRKFHERRETEYRNHRERLEKIEREHDKDLRKAHEKHQRELDDHYRDFLRATR